MIDEKGRAKGKRKGRESHQHNTTYVLPKSNDRKGKESKGRDREREEKTKPHIVLEACECDY